MLRNNAQHAGEKTVNPELTAKALAKAVCDGDIVNFRFLFSPFSPARRDSTERFETPKYAYLLPDTEMEHSDTFRAVLQIVRRGDIWAHVEQELEAKRPAQMPSELLLMLADNAVRSEKYTSAAQAYEVLRIRARMQEEFLNQGEIALDKGDIPRAVRAYLVAASLEYDYGAFPEPLPAVPNFQTRALMLHGDYPATPEESLPFQELPVFLRTGFTYLLLNPSLAAKLESRPIETRLDFFERLVHERDPRWGEFATRYQAACRLTQEFAERIQRALQNRAGGGDDDVLEDEIYAQLGENPMEIAAQLLGRSIPNGEWWQYLKEIAGEHPPGILFLSRQVIGEHETLLPRYRADSPLPIRLGLVEKRAE
ncbi:MAG TPA: hypothetical protein PKY35_11505 [Candidatus Hydrogenedentes bacterium]|nr:hypothetical protein [Candidatus Hydrogenedentota bacterium]HOL77643.1 hypothetical protein [Candidatus Hydrogenedentota bacterium]HPO87375.1 hypothetical protein [Candidatus Hydrogenedentota bacterium]